MRIRVVRWGFYCQVLSPPPEVVELIRRELAYTRRIMERKFQGYQCRTAVRQEIRVLAELVRDEQGILCDRLVFPAGMLLRVGNALRQRGLDLEVVDRFCLASDPQTSLSREEYVRYWQPQTQHEANLTWRWRQQEALDRLCQAMCGVVMAPTGYGKGTLISRFCQRYPTKRIDIVTHSLEVVETLYYRLVRDGIRGVGWITGQKYRPGRVQVISGKSLHRTDGQADVLLADELQELATDDYLLSVTRHYRWARRLAFTANCWDRADKADFETEAVFGPVIFYMGYQEAVEHGCVTPITVLWKKVPSGPDLSGISDEVRRKRKGIWRNAERNALIAETARSFGDDEQVLIFVEKIEHAIYLSRYLPEFELVYSVGGLSPSDRMEYVRRGLLPSNFPEMTDDRKRHLRRAFELGQLRKVIATPVWSRGVDFSQLSVLIRADAQRSSVGNTQLPGRTSRLHVEKSMAYLVDFVDLWDAGTSGKSGFLSASSQRRRDYHKHGWKQIDFDSFRSKGSQTELVEDAAEMAESSGSRG